jgi:nitrate/TMAO reductase-like tetraheme cytochrome c subunit
MGAAIAIASLLSVVLLFLIEVTGATENPYLGILTYIIFPTVLVFGLAVVVLGGLIERRRRHRSPDWEIAEYPRLDLNDPRSRKAFFTFLLVTFLFVSASAFGSYRAYEFTESVEFCGASCHTPMKPEYTAYLASPHARVRCVDCHVGPGAGWYVRSKLSGAYQLYSVTFNKYPRPITTPVHNLRPAPETCEQCHWPEKFFGAQLKVFTHYAYDESNSRRQTRMLINVGGGSPSTGVVAGIHWHMNIGNEVTYISTDAQRQTIPWVKIKDRSGKEQVFYDKRRALTPEQIANGNRRRMDCVDCHNRPAHIYQPPDQAVDQSIAAGRLDPSLPYIKKQAVEVLSRHYSTTGEAVNTISKTLDSFYKTHYPEVHTQKQPLIKNAIAEVQRIFQTFFFPEMQTDWQTHPNNIGHFYSVGCFRCHDGEHVSDDGQIIRNDCNICHTVLSDSARQKTTGITEGDFKHPVDLGALADRQCTTCHKGDKPFQHPVNLGDISPFQCSECHPKK